MVSVIIPNYNHEKYLRQRIDSVLNQTYQDFELIILDDCSTDNSKAVIEGYRNHPKVSKILYNEENSGSTFKQWAKGIEAATGDFIWIAESDDYADERFLEVLLNEADINPSIGVAYTQSWRVDEKNNILYSCKSWYPERWKQNFSNKGPDEIQNFMIWHGITNASSAIFRSSLVKEIDIDYTSFKLLGDWLFWFQLVNASGVFYCAQELNFFRDHSQNSSKRSYKEGLEIIEGLEALSLIRNRITNYSLYNKKTTYYIQQWLNNFLFQDSIDRKKQKLFFMNAYRASAQITIKSVLLLPAYYIRKKISKWVS